VLIEGLVADGEFLHTRAEIRCHVHE
jgi:hypothetical protein